MIKPMRLHIGDKVAIVSLSWGGIGDKDLIHKYFGQDRTVTHENIICPTENQPLYIYDASTETYTQNANHPGHGGGSTGIITDNNVVVD